MQADYANRVTADRLELQRAKDREDVSQDSGRKQGAFAEASFCRVCSLCGHLGTNASLMDGLNGSHCDTGV